MIMNYNIQIVTDREQNFLLLFGYLRNLLFFMYLIIYDILLHSIFYTFIFFLVLK